VVAGPKKKHSPAIKENDSAATAAVLAAKLIGPSAAIQVMEIEPAHIIYNLFHTHGQA